MLLLRLCSEDQTGKGEAGVLSGDRAASEKAEGVSGDREQGRHEES